MQWRRIDPNNPPRYTVVGGNFDKGSKDYDEKRLGRVVNIAGSGIYLISVCNKLFTVTHYQPMANFDVIAGLEPTGRGTYYFTRLGVQILATTFENAVFLADYLKIEWEDLCPGIEEVDASDIGGRLGEAINLFDPRTN